MNIEQNIEEELTDWWNNLNDWWKTTFKQYIFKTFRNTAELKTNKLTIEEIEKVLKIETINLWGEVESLEPLRKLTDLKKFVCDLKINDLEPIQNLIKLETVNIVGTQIENLKPLANLKNLRELYCFRTKVKTIKPIMELTKMELLWIGNQVSSNEITEFKHKHPNCKINPKYS